MASLRTKNFDFLSLAYPSDSTKSVATNTPRLTSQDPPQEDDASGLSARALEAMAWFKETYKEQLSRISKPGDGSGVRSIDMMTAENWLARDVLVSLYQESVHRGLTERHLSYAPGFGGEPALLEKAASFYNAFFNPAQPVQGNQVVVGAGCSSLLASLIHDLCGEGEGLLIETPYWGGFEMECMMRAQVKMIAVQSGEYYAGQDRDPQRLVRYYERAIRVAGCQVRALLLCNPHNPRGQLYSVAELTALVEFCHAHRLHLISDEIYGLSTFDATFTPVMSLTLPDPCRVHTLHGISKDFGSSGLRLGFVVTQAHPLLRMSLALSNHAKVSTVSALMAASLLGDHARLRTLLKISNAALRDAAAEIVDFLNTRHVPFHQPVAGVFIWARLCRNAKSAEDELHMSRAFRTAGVDIVAGSSCREPQSGWFRITFALPRADLLLGLQRISGVLDVFNNKAGSGP